ncbi:transporter substrate-binding domain-containing protein [Arcanobacterium phocae]|uniref:Amino acid ABC transporter substrate-binding protein, PAAT family n=1 Tax=Arcanobacterium phocae TaxID=131112 RepID=A0A1H2LG18_9ACTO|nr:transporter substrate-binding domain-containing protein [Arcanobacterium phocae]SDU79957.1 amino acid ABC transporter substrate-binding protein, PAAT family [Arcanobacterium phocae]
MSITKRASSLIVAALALVACSTSASAPSGKLLDETRQARTIMVGTEGTYRPYSYTDEKGNLTGIEIDIMKLLAHDLGAEVNFTVAPWDGLIAGVDAGKYPVVINNLAVSSERQAKYDFSQPYTRDVGRFAVRQDSPLVSITDLAHHKAAQSTTSNLGMLARDKFNLDILPVDGFAQAIDLVAAGRADTTLNSLVTFKLYQESNPDASIRLLDGEVETPGCCSILVKKGEDAFVTALNDAIEKRLEDGSIAEITKKYVGEDISARPQVKAK